MSRHGYNEGDPDNWATIRWQGALKRAIEGKRGQAFLRELAAALDAMPEKRLIAGNLIDDDGEVCALGAVGRARGMTDLADINLDVECHDVVAEAFAMSETLAREVQYQNDEECTWPRAGFTPEMRWQSVRKWVSEKLTEAAKPGEEKT